MLNLDAEQIVQSLSMQGLIESMRQTYQHHATIPQRRVMPLKEGEYDAFALLPAWNDSLITVKAFTYFPNNCLQGRDSLASKILAFDRSHGEPLALLDGKVLMRSMRSPVSQERRSHCSMVQSCCRVRISI